MSRRFFSGWLRVASLLLALSLFVDVGARSARAEPTLLPGPYIDVDLRHDQSEPHGGRIWGGNYYDDLDNNGCYTPGEDVYEYYDRDWKIVNYQEDFWYNPETGQTESEEWDPLVGGSYDYSAWMAAGVNLWASYRGLADPEGTYETLAYQTGLNGFLWDEYGSHNDPHVVLDHAGINRFVMKTDGAGGFDWYCPMEYVQACLREGMPVSLGYGGGYLTVHGIDPFAQTLQATDTHHDPGGDNLATYYYDLDTLALSGPAEGTIDYVCSEDLISWYRGMNGYWSNTAAWANQHVPTAAQTVYLSHPYYINLNVEGPAQAKAIYFNTPNPGQRMNLGTGANLTISQDVTLGDTGNGEIHHYDGDMTVGTNLLLGLASGGKGEYEIQGGTLTTGSTRVGVGGMGRFIHDGGTHKVNGLLSLGHEAGGDGYYELRQRPGAVSKLEALNEIIGHDSVGYFKQTAGTNQVSSLLTIGSHAMGTYRLEGGHLDLGLDMQIGSDASGLLHQTGGSVTAGRDVFIGGTKSGTYRLEGGSFSAFNVRLGTETAGQFAQFIQSGDTNVYLGRLTVGAGASGLGSYTMTGGLLGEPSPSMEANTLILGEAGTGEFRQTGASSTVTLREASWVGYGGDAKGTYVLDRGLLYLGGVLHVGRTSGLNAGQQAPEAHLGVESGFIQPLDPNVPGAMVVVHGSRAALTGEGAYGIAVRLESDPEYGASSDQAVSVSFAKDILTRSKTFYISEWITDDNVGSQEKSQRLHTATLDDSWFRISWSHAGDPGDLEYNHTTSTNPKPLPEVAVPYDPAQIAGNARVSASDIEKRMHFWQFREGVARNIADIDDDGVVAVDPTGKMIHGEARRMEGDFALAVGGKAVDPVHQNPAIAALHARGLTGEGVKIGQLEKYVPYRFHGCFADWNDADPSKLRVSVEAGAEDNNHATQVASLMVGYDPLGLQVDGLSRFADPDERYGSGLGFVGAAPGAELCSRSLPGSGEFPDELAYLASVEGMKIVNASSSFSFNPPQPTNGMSAPAKCVDHWVAEHWAQPVALGNGRMLEAVAGGGLIYVQAVGNGGDVPGSLRIPADSYNCITVGAVEFDSAVYPTHFDASYASVAGFSGRGPTDDGRVGIDLVAQGVGNLSAFAMTKIDSGQRVYDLEYEKSASRGLYSTSVRTATAADPNATMPVQGTSYAAPTVAGVAALMVEQARNMGEPLGESPLVVKSILMTSADKIDGWEKGALGVADDDHAVPLDYSQGAGLLDPIGAVDLLAEGREHHGRDPVDPKGWAWTALFADDFSEEWGFDGHMYFLENVAQGSSLTATLNWYRHVWEDGEVLDLTDLNLELLCLEGDSMFRVDWSQSAVDNIEHLYCDNLIHGGNYFLHVSGNFLTGRFVEEYALSWELAGVVPEPQALVLVLIGACFLMASRRIARGRSR